MKAETDTDFLKLRGVSLLEVCVIGTGMEYFVVNSGQKSVYCRKLKMCVTFCLS